MYLRRHGSLPALALFLLAAVVVPWLPAADDETPPGVVVALKGHHEAVYGVAFTGDSKFLVTASGDPSVKVWHLPSGKEIKSYTGSNGHKGIVLNVVLSPDGSQFVTGSADNTARVWDFPTSKHLREFLLAGEGRSVAVSPDGTRLAGGTSDGKLRLWNAADGKQLHEIAAHTAAITGLTFSSNGQILASVSADSTLRFWNVADGKPLAAYAAHSGPVTGVAYNSNSTVAYTTGKDGTLKFWTMPPTATRNLQAPFKDPVTTLAMSADASQVVAASGTSVRLASITNGQTTREFAGATGIIHGVAANPTLVAAGTSDRHLVVWQTKDAQVLSRTVAHGGAVADVAFNPAGNLLATAGKDGYVRVWNMPPLPTRSLTLPEAVRSAVLSTDGQRLVTGTGDKLVRIYQLKNLTTPERQFSGHKMPINAVALSPDARTVASAGDSGILRFWDAAKGAQKAAIGAHTAPATGLVYLANNTQALSTSQDGSIKLWQVPTTTALPTFTHAGAVTSAVLSPDGARVLTGCADRQVRLWNLSTGKMERTWTGPTLGIQAVAFSRAGDRVAASSADRSLFVWETNSNKEVRKLVNLPAVVQAIALAADGKHLVAGLADGTVRVFDMTSGKEVNNLVGHKGAVNVLLLNPKGELILSAGADGEIRSRALAGKAPGTTIKHGSPIHALALSRDGLRLAVGGADKTIKVYTLATGKPETTIATPAEVRGLSFNIDGKKLAVAGSDGKARIFAITGELEEYLTHEGPVSDALYTTDGKRIVTTSADKTAQVWTPALVWQGRHEGAVHQAILNARTPVVLSGGADGMVRIWNIADGKPLQAIRAHTGAVSALALSGDTSRLATTGADRTARIWEMAKLPSGKTGGKALDPATHTLTLPVAGTSATFSANGQRIAIGLPAAMAGKDQVRIFDALSGTELLTLGDPEGMPAHVLQFLPDNRTLLAGGADRTVRLVDVNIHSAFEAHKGGASGVAFHSNGTQMVTGGADGTVKLWTFTTGKLERTLGPLGAPVSALTLPRDFTRVAAVGGKTLKVWTLADGKEEVLLTLPSECTALSFNVNRTTLATACQDGKARVWDLATKKELVGFLHAGPVTGVAFHPSTPTLLVSGSADRTVGVQTVGVTRIVDAGTPLAGLTVAPNNVHILIPGADGKTRIVNSGSGNVERSLETGGPAATAVTVTRNSQLIAVAAADRKVRVHSYNDGKLLSAFTAPANPRSVAFSPNNQALVAAGEDGSVTTWDTTYAPGQPLPAEFGKVLQVYAHAAGGALDVSFPTAGSIFYTAGADRAIKAWKLASDSATRTFNHPNTVNAVAINPAGTQLLTGCADGKMRLFDLEKGTQLREIAAHTTMNQTAIYSVAFSPDGKQVLSASVDNSLKLFNAADGKPIREFKAYKEKVFPRGHQEAVLCAAFSPDGKQIASGSMDRTIKIWNVADGNVIRDMANPALKVPPGASPQSHPGWVYALRYADGGKKLVSVGGAPRLHGYLAVWDVNAGKPLFGKELAIGTIFSLDVAPNGQEIAVGTGGSVRSAADLHTGLVLKLPTGK